MRIGRIMRIIYDCVYTQCEYYIYAMRILYIRNANVIYTHMYCSEVYICIVMIYVMLCIVIIYMCEKVKVVRKITWC